MSNNFDFSKNNIGLDSAWLVALGTRFEPVRFLGRGAFGEVIEAIDHNSNSRVAIKRIYYQASVMDAKRVSREIKILMHADHPNIVRLIDIICPTLSCRDSDINNSSINTTSSSDITFSSIQQYMQDPPSDSMDSNSCDSKELYLVMEFVDTDLYKVIGSAQFISNDHVKYFLKQILYAVQYLHKSSIIHRDLKPANILVTENCSLKICDFGLSRFSDSNNSNNIMNNTSQSPKNCNIDCSGMSSSSSIFGSSSVLPKPVMKRGLTQHVVTRWYRAPELILMEHYSFEVDIWSVGCIFAELLGMLKENISDYGQRRALFPGKSCYPLSDDGSHNREIEFDQLAVVLDVLGSPSESDLNFISNERSKQLIRSMKKGKKDFSSIFPGSDPMALDLLSSMLQFNPENRISVDKALKHPYLKNFKTSVPEYDLIQCNWQEYERMEDILEIIREDVCQFSRLSYMDTCASYLDTLCVPTQP